MLNESFTTIHESLSRGTPVAPGYLIATLQAFNATQSYGPNDGALYTQAASGNNSANTGLAMSVFSVPSLSWLNHCDDVRIILYAITGCVSALFCIVIISGVSVPLHVMEKARLLTSGYRRFVRYVIPSGTDPEWQSIKGV